VYKLKEQQYKRSRFKKKHVQTTLLSKKRNIKNRARGGKKGGISEFKRPKEDILTLPFGKTNSTNHLYSQ